MPEANKENSNLNPNRSTPPRVVNSNEADDLSEIDLIGLVTAVLRRWKLCAAICGVMIAAGLAYCLMVPTQYQTTSRVFVDVGQLKTTPKDEVQFVLSGKVLQKVFDDFKFGETKAFSGDTEYMKHFRNLYDVKEVPKTSLIEIAFKDPDVKRAAAVNAATAQGYISDVRDRVRQVLVNEQAVLQVVQAQREKERTEAIAALEAFKTKHGILSSDMQSVGMENDLPMADGTPHSARSWMPSIMYMPPSKVQVESEKNELEQKRLDKRLAQIDALIPEYQRLNGRYLAALAAYQQAFNAVKGQAAKIEGINGDALARVAVPPTDDESLLKKQPAKAKVMAIVVLASLVLSVLVCVVLELLDRTVKTRREFERLSGLPVLAEVKPGTKDEYEKWQTAMTLLALSTSEDHKAFAIVKTSDLKTDISVALLLASEFTSGEKDILLISFQSKAKVTEWLKRNGGRWGTATEKLSSTLTCQKVEIYCTEFYIGISTEPNVAKALQVAREAKFGIILMDPEPLTDSAEALNISAADGVQTVVIGELRQTKRDELINTLQMLDRVKADVVGSVLLGK